MTELYSKFEVVRMWVATILWVLFLKVIPKRLVKKIKSEEGGKQ